MRWLDQIPRQALKSVKAYHRNIVTKRGSRGYAICAIPLRLRVKETPSRRKRDVAATDAPFPCRTITPDYVARDIARTPQSRLIDRPLINWCPDDDATAVTGRCTDRCYKTLIHDSIKSITSRTSEHRIL